MVSQPPPARADSAADAPLFRPQPNGITYGAGVVVGFLGGFIANLILVVFAFGQTDELPGRVRQAALSVFVVALSAANLALVRRLLKAPDRRGYGTGLLVAFILIASILLLILWFLLI